jgi:hypothetical protein
MSFENNLPPSKKHENTPTSQKEHENKPNSKSNSAGAVVLTMIVVSMLF